MKTVDWKYINEQIQKLREQYPKGTRVRLLRADEENFDAPPIGTLGTIERISNIGLIYVHWDTGITVDIYEDDEFEVVHED